MTILSSNFNQIGNAGQQPGTIMIETDDTFAAIQATGYLNVLAHQNLPLSENLMALVSIGTGASKSTVWMAIQFANGNWSLVPSAVEPSLNAKYIIQAPNATLPNAQSMSALGTGIVKNTTGTGIQSIATAGVDYQAALSGASLTAVTVATDDKVLIQDTSDSNNLKTVTAQSIANLAAGGSGVFTQIKTTVTSPQILDMLNTPVLLLAAPGSGKIILLSSVTIIGVFNSISYTAGDVLAVSYDGFDGISVYENIPATAVTTTNLVTVPVPITYANVVAQNLIVNQGIYIWSGGVTPFANGNGTLDVYLTYQVVTI